MSRASHVTAKVQLHVGGHTQLVIDKGVQARSVSCSKLALEGLITLQPSTSCSNGIQTMHPRSRIDGSASVLPEPASARLGSQVRQTDCRWQGYSVHVMYNALLLQPPA